MPADPLRVVIVSNRGPFSFSYRGDELKVQRGSGGLVTAMTAIAREHEVTWISCALSKGDRQWLSQVGDGAHDIGGIRLRLVVPDSRKYQAYYNVISNPLLWFLQHQMYDTPRNPVFDESTWKAWSEGYAGINRQLAVVTADTIRNMDGRILVMPQDYHLYLFPKYLRQLAGDRVTIQSFLHIPWPGPDAWLLLPQSIRRELLESMLYADRVGLQTQRDMRRFLQTCGELLPGAHVDDTLHTVSYKGRETEAASYPISIDSVQLEDRLNSGSVQKHVRLFQSLYSDRKLVLRVDRVEPSKNILRGLTAFRNFVTAYPKWQGRVNLLALLVPSRTEVPEYQQYLREIMMQVGEINATLGDADWEPVRVLLGNNYARAIAALSLYDALLINPLADGMNLVAKEGAVLNRRNGVLILSEEAGVAEEFGDFPLLVSPYDVYGTREALHNALTMPDDERRERARRLAEQVRTHDIYAWFGRQLEDADGIRETET